MISTATDAVTATEAGSPVPSQKPRVAAAMAMTTGTNTAAIRSARRWTGALPACASWTRRAIWASLVSAPTRVARTTSRPPALTVPPVTASPGTDFEGNRLTGEQRSVDRRRAVFDHTVGGDLVTGPHHEAIADDERVDSDAVLGVVIAEHDDVLGAQLEQGTKRRSGVALGAGLQVAAGEDQRRHPGSDLQEDLARRHVAVGDQAEAVLQAGFPGVAEEQGVQRPPEGGEHTDGDQGVHRRRGVAQVDPGRAVERPGSPHDHRGGEGQRQPLPVVELEEREHAEGDDRQRQDRRHDQAAPGLVDAMVVGHVGVGPSGLGPRDMGVIAGGPDGGNEIIDAHGRGGPHPRFLGGEVDGGLHAIELVEALLDPRRARRARHPIDLQVDLEVVAVGDGRRHRVVSSHGHRDRSPAR